MRMGPHAMLRPRDADAIAGARLSEGSLRRVWQFARPYRTAIAFFVLGVGLGMYMGMNQDFRLMHVHAHVNLLGWRTHWLIAFVLLTIVFAFALRGPLGVTF